MNQSTKILRILYIPAFIIMTLLIISYFLPSEYGLKRKIVISAPKKKIYDKISLIRKWKYWSARNKSFDTTIVFAYRGDSKQQGSSLIWYGEKTGSGEVEITGRSVNTYVKYFMDIENGYFISRGKILLETVNDKTKDTWTDKGEVFKNPFLKYFIYLTDGFTSNEIELSLKNLKNQKENNNRQLIYFSISYLYKIKFLCEII